MCNRPCQVDVDLITKMRGGSFAGYYVHRDCALSFLAANPGATTEGATVIHFHRPCENVVAKIGGFTSGAIKKLTADSVAGSGKSNTILFACAELRRLGKSFVVLVFNTLARDNLIKGGLTPREVYTFHSFGFGIFQEWVRTTLGEQAELLERTRDARSFSAVVCPSAVRLCVAFHFRDHPQGKTLTLLLRPFVHELSQQARTHGFGLVDGPDFFDTDGLLHLVQKYSLQEKLESMWRVSLSQPQKTAVDRAIGCGADRRLDFALGVTSHVLDYVLRFSTSMNVDGATGLLNEAKGEFVPAPLTDPMGMIHAPAAKDLSSRQYDAVLLDEFQDADTPQMTLAKNALRPGGGIMAVRDDSQACYSFRGTEKAAQDEFLHGSTEVHLHTNYRSATAICAEAQEILDQMGRPVKIIPHRTDKGKVVTAPIWAEPFNLRVSTLMLARCTRHLLVAYKALLEEHLPVAMHNMPETMNELRVCLADIPGSLAQVMAKLDAAIATQAPVANQLGPASYEIKASLRGCIDIFLATRSDLNPSQPHARHALYDWLPTFFCSQQAGVVPGVIFLATPHAAKGLEADDVYILNPSMIPLTERVAFGGWKGMEELCVAYIARSRARHRMIYLPDLEMTSRQEMKALLRRPIPASSSEASAPPSQDSEATASTEEGGASTASALETLGLDRMPETVVDLNEATRALLRRLHPHSARAAATVNTGGFDADAVMAARQHLKAVLEGKAV